MSDIGLETEVYFLRKENVRLYEAIKMCCQPQKECDGIQTWKDSHCPGCTATQVPRKERCTCHYTDERVEDPKCPRHCKPTAPETEKLKNNTWYDESGPRKPASEGRCAQCENPDQKGLHTCQDASERAVEAKIDLIVMGWSKQDDLVKQLRELVNLARGEKPEKPRCCCPCDRCYATRCDAETCHNREFRRGEK